MGLRKDGFIDQRLIYMPIGVIDNILVNQLVQDLYITHIGSFPKALGHFRERPNGCDQFILIYCTEGEGWIQVEDRLVKLEKNQMFIIEPNVASKYGASEYNPWSIYWFHFAGKNARLYAPKLNQVLNVPIGVNSRIDERLLMFEEMYQNLENHYNFDKVVYANICLKHFLASVKFLSEYRSVNKEISVNKLGTAISYMQANINNRITIKDISEVCNCSEANISRLFKTSLKSAPIDYFIHIKMLKACKMLLNTELLIKEISFKLGYDDPYYFSRIFKKHIGLSPSLYREEEKGR